MDSSALLIRVIKFTALSEGHSEDSAFPYPCTPLKALFSFNLHVKILIENIQMQAWLQSIVYNQRGFSGLYCLINDDVDSKEEDISKSQEFSLLVDATSM